MSKEAMQMALHTLEGWANYGNWVWPESALEQAKRNTTESIAALRQAPKEKQEPVAWMMVNKVIGPPSLHWKPQEDWHITWECKPLYTAPPKREWVGLTEEDMEALFLNEDGVRFARYIEAKLREKNNG